MRSGRLGGTILASVALLGSGQAAARPKPVAILAKADTSLATRNADKAECRRIVDKAPGRDMPAVERTNVGAPMDGSGGAPAVAGAAIVMLIFEMIENGRAADRGESLCMQNRGYAPLQLTPEEATAYRALAPEKRSAWENTFLSQDLTQRIAAATARKVPPLPDYADEPEAIGGLRFLVDGFTATDKPVGAGDVVLTGKVERSRTAVLANDFKSEGGPITIAGKAGAVFHQVDYRPQRDPALREPGATWCGPVDQVSGASAAPSVYCLTTRQSGYEAYRPTGFGWLAGPPGAGFALPMLTSAIALEERDADDLGPLDFAIVVDKVTASAVELTGVVTRKGQRVKIWNRRLKAGDDKSVVVPLWQRRLVLGISPTFKVSAKLEDSAEGKSLRDAW